MLERIYLEKRRNLASRIQLLPKPDGELLEEYPLAEFVRESDELINADRLHPKEVVENANALTKRVEIYE